MLLPATVADACVLVAILSFRRAPKRNPFGEELGYVLLRAPYSPEFCQHQP